MVTYENNCVGCPTYCIDCGAKHQMVCYCDKCGDEVSELYKWNDEQWCRDCIISDVEDNLEEVDYDD